MRGPRQRHSGDGPVVDCGDAELFQILGGQLRQYPRVDLVLAKRLFVSLKPSSRSRPPMSIVFVPALVFGA